MDSRTKSDILREISECIDKNANTFIECNLKKTSKVIHLDLRITDQQTFTDENGVEWIRK